MSFKEIHLSMLRCLLSVDTISIADVVDDDNNNNNNNNYCYQTAPPAPPEPETAPPAPPERWWMRLLRWIPFTKSLGCFSVPAPDVRAIATKGLTASVTEFNTRYAPANLYRVTKSSLQKVVPVGLDTYDVFLKLVVKQTECAKTAEQDPQTCAFSNGFLVSRVRVTLTGAQVLSLNCGHGSSSSSSSSESMERDPMRQYRFHQGGFQTPSSSSPGPPHPTPKPRDPRDPKDAPDVQLQQLSRIERDHPAPPWG
ncbi:hypothetical protein CRUP_009075 [Coryphaenoides rupestris]|nr:hypothetical protein CRUP_009075 [Coryphaenoides rupestris]